MIAPATVYSDGSLVPELNSGFFDLDDSEISNFLNSNKIIVDINLSTSNSDNDEYVKIYADYECVLKIGVETKINME